MNILGSIGVGFGQILFSNVVLVCGQWVVMEEGVVWGIGNKVVIFVVVGEVVIRWIVFDRVNVVVIFGLSFGFGVWYD